MSQDIAPQETFFHSRLFKGLSKEDMQEVAGFTKSKRIKAGTYLFRQHSKATHAYTLISGALMLERTSQSGRRQVIDFSHPGNFIGITNNDEFEFSVYCLRDAHLQCYVRSNFLELADRNPILKNNIRRTGSNVLTHTLDQLFALGQKKAHERVCYLLHELSFRQPGTDRETIDLFMNRQDIADYLGLTIETVSRAFSKLKKDGIIAVDSPHRVRIVDNEQLDALASAR